MDGFKETPCRAPLLKGKGCFGDEIRGVRPGNVNAEEFACAFFGNDFEESGKRAHSLRLAEFPELENRRTGRYPLLSGLLFRQSHIADFRRSKNGRRNHRIRLYFFLFRVQDVMNRRMRFGCGHVCQHDPPWAGDVANGIHAGD